MNEVWNRHSNICSKHTRTFLQPQPRKGRVPDQHMGERGTLPSHKRSCKQGSPPCISASLSQNVTETVAAGLFTTQWLV